MQSTALIVMMIANHRLFKECLKNLNKLRWEDVFDNQILLTVYYVLLLIIEGILKCIETYNEQSNLILRKIRVRILTYKNTDAAKKNNG